MSQKSKVKRLVTSMQPPNKMGELLVCASIAVFCHLIDTVAVNKSSTQIVPVKPADDNNKGLAKIMALNLLFFVFYLFALFLFVLMIYHFIGFNFHFVFSLGEVEKSNSE